MKRDGHAWLASIVLSVGLLCLVFPTAQGQEGGGGKAVKLPEPRYDGPVSVERAIKERRSVRTYADAPLTLAEIAQLMWAAQGVTEPSRGLRAVPSAKAAYYVTVYVVAGKVSGLTSGLYRYQPKGHQLERMAEGDKKRDLYKAAPQAQINTAPAALVIAGQADRASSNPSWMYLEAGHISQNVYLQCVSLNLSTVTMAGFKEEEVAKVLGLAPNEKPIYLMAIGKKK